MTILDIHLSFFSFEEFQLSVSQNQHKQHAGADHLLINQSEGFPGKTESLNEACIVQVQCERIKGTYFCRCYAEMLGQIDF